MQSREELFLKIMVWFSVCTAIVGLFNMAAAGQITLGSFGVDTIPGQITVGTSGTGSGGGGYTEGANTANGTVVSGVDFTTATVINQNITTTLGGTWILENGVGLVLTTLPWFPGDLDPSAVIARNVRSTDGVYTVNALINNIPGTSFYVFPRYISGYSGSDIKIVFAVDGIHIKKFPLSFGFLDAGDDYFYPLANAQATLSGGSTITTQLREAVSSSPSNTPDYTAVLTVSKDGSELFTTNVRSILPGNNINDMVRHGGAGSDSINFIIKGFPNTNMLDTAETIYSGSLVYSTGGVNPLDAIAQFLAMIGIITGLSNTAAVPFWLWAILTGCPIATLIYMNLELLRGT